MSVALALAAATPAEEAPSLELLLHLAEFSDAEGRALDPATASEILETPRPDAAAAAPTRSRPPAAGARAAPRQPAARDPEAEPERPSDERD